MDPIYNYRENMKIQNKKTGDVEVVMIEDSGSVKILDSDSKFGGWWTLFESIEEMKKNGWEILK